MKIPSLVVFSLTGVALFTQARAATIVKDNNTDALNVGTSWIDDPVLGNVAPGPADIALFDGTISAPLSSALGGDLSWQGIQVTNVGGARNAATTNVTIASAGSANTLAIGAGGIDMSSALQALRIEARISLTANQTWDIANANTAVNPAGLNKSEDLCFFALAAATPLDLGGFTVTKTGAGVVAIATGYAIANGTFNVDAGVLQVQSGGSRTTTINGAVVINVNTGASLRIAAESGAGGVGIQSSGTINLNAGSTMTLQPNQATAINLAGNITVAAGGTALTVVGGSTAPVTLSGNLIGAGDIAYANTATNNRLVMTGDNNAYTGTITLNGVSGTRALGLASATAGSARANWVITAGNILQIDGVPVSLGTLNGAGTITNSSGGSASISVGSGLFTGLIDNGAGSMAVTKVGSGILELTAANPYNGGSSVQGGTLQITAAQTGGGPLSISDAATLAIRFATPTSFNSLSLTFGSAAGSTLSIDLGTLSNPTVPIIVAPNFTVNGTNTIVLSGSGLTAGTFTLIDYSGPIGGSGFSGLTFSTPIPRIIASLVNNTAAQSVDLTISGLDKPKWTGAISNAWDIDTGAGTGTANWKEVASGNVTRYRQTASGNDSVLFDDSASGMTTVDLTTTLSPSGIEVNSSTRAYTFTGAGKLSGAGGLLKQGSSDFTIANTGGNDYTGPTTINSGSLLLGNGGAGEGQLGVGPLVDNSVFVINRPDDLVIANNISGSGVITKRGQGIATLSGTNTLNGATTIQAGAIQLSGFGNLPGGVVNNGTLILEGGTPMTGAVSGPGIVSAQGPGTKQISGSTANTYTGGTSIMQGLLQLNKTPGVAAVGGDVTIEGTGQLQLLAADQIPDSATITYNSGGASTVIGNETIANITIIGGSETSQVNANNGLVVTNLLTMSTGVFSVASNHSATIAGINISGGTLRIAANGNPSTLTVGAGGITATGGLIQVGQGGNNFDAQLILDGNYTGSGFVEFARGNYFGANKREINLGAPRTFNVISDVTTIRPDIVGSGGLIKSGDGILSLTGTNSFTGDTTIQAGTLALSGTLSGSPNIDVKGAATFDVVGVVPAFTLGAGQTLKGTGMVAGSVTAAGTLAPGEPIGTLTFAGDLTLVGISAFEINKSGFTLGADLAAVSGLINYGGTLNVVASGNSLSFGDRFNLFDAASFSGSFANLNLPPLGSGLRWDASRLPIDGTLVVIPEPGSSALLLAGLGSALGLRRYQSRVTSRPPRRRHADPKRQ